MSETCEGPGRAGKLKQRRKSIETRVLRSEKLASLDHEAERVFWRIVIGTDSWGTIDFTDVRSVRLDIVAEVYGMTNESLVAAVDRLVAVGLVERWQEEWNGSVGTWVHVTGYDSHQTPKFLSDRRRSKRTSPIPPSIRAVVGTNPPVEPTRTESKHSYRSRYESASGADSFDTPSCEEERRGKREEQISEPTGSARERAHEPTEVEEEPTAEMMLERTLLVLADCSVLGTTADDYRGNLDTYRFMKPATPPEVILQAAGRAAARVKDTGRPFKVAQGWKYVELEVPKILAERHAPTRPRFGVDADQPSKRRTAAELLAEQERIWGQPA